MEKASKVCLVVLLLGMVGTTYADPVADEAACEKHREYSIKMYTFSNPGKTYPLKDTCHHAAQRNEYSKQLQEQMRKQPPPQQEQQQRDPVNRPRNTDGSDIPH